VGEEIEVTRDGGIVIASLGSDGLGVPTVYELRSLCAGLAGEDSTQAFVLVAQHRSLSGWRSSPCDSGVQALAAGADSFRAVGMLPMPSIIAIEDDAFEGGAELALAFDIRVAGAKARFRLGDLEGGRMPFAGGTQRLARIAGRARALELVLWGESIDAGKALAAGIVTRLVPPGTAGTEALGLARTIASRGPLGVRYTKEAILRGADLPLEYGLRLETDLATLLQSTEDRAEGVDAFKQKRVPHFRGE
jgi:enoyl-CoA hydratase/carnithine racemase